MALVLRPGTELPHFSDGRDETVRSAQRAARLGVTRGNAEGSAMTLQFCRFATCNGARFYQSFDGYKVPPKPIGPVAFSQTERLTAFFIARHDDQERLAWFAKVLVERKGITERFIADSQ